MTYEPVPFASSAFWHDSIPENMRADYILLGEKYLNQPWTVLPVSVFSEFKTIGNRVNFEQLTFARRRQFVSLVMAEVMENKGRFLPDIINGVLALCEETWWGIPAHYSTKVPTTDDQNVDLFNAETAGMMAWASYILKQQLDAFSPILVQRIYSEINRRMLKPCLETQYGWKRNTSNWNPWICSNWLTCVLLAESDRERQVKAVQMIMESLDFYMDSAPDDGGCNEGPSYWTHAAGSLSDCLITLKQATAGHVDVSRDAKVGALGSFLYKTYIGNGFAVNFADASVFASSEVNIVFPFGVFIDDDIMKEYAAQVALNKDFWNKPADMFNEAGNYPSLGHELRFLSLINTFRKTDTKEPLIADSWLPNLQVMTARSIEGSTKGFYIAAKGGYNAENHNHNDAGSYVVYFDGEPLIIDVGVGTYTSKTFSKERYDIWTMQSGFHNLPKINGIDQKDGASYKAANLKYKKHKTEVVFSLDIAGAYPAEAKVKSWTRTFKFNRKKEIEITENYCLHEYEKTTEIMLMTCCEPSITDKGVVLKMKDSQRLIAFDNSLTPTIEYIKITDQRLLKSWKPDMWRIKLAVNKTDLCGVIKYYIQ
ncbi:MAG: heparinase II/III family protein [Prolixibacteraceae bacterium]|nr:heparinase II/III family protein [Prolixibacteraceae bacterium]